MAAVAKVDITDSIPASVTKGKAQITKKTVQPEKTIPQLSVERSVSHSGAREYISHKQEVSTLEEILMANRETIRRLKVEKKELLRTNFVV